MTDNTNGLFAGLNDRLSQVERDVASIDATLHTVSRTMQDLSSKVDRPNNWVGIGALIISVAAVGGTYFNTRLGPVESEATLAESRLRDHELSDGHSGAKMGVARNHERLLQLDEVLQREMRLLNDRTRADLDSLDRRLQGEIANNNASTIDALTEVRRRIDRLNDWQTEHDKTVSGVNADQSARIKDIERRLMAGGA